MKKLVILTLSLLMLGATQSLAALTTTQITPHAPIAAQTGATDWWPQFKHDPANTGVSTSTAPNSKHILWKYKIHGSFTAPVIADGKVFVAAFGNPLNGWTGKLYCLDATNGSILWTFTPTKRQGISDSPTIVNGKVYFGTNNEHRLVLHYGEVYCLDENTGNLLWNTGNNFIFNSLNIINDRIYLNSNFKPAAVLCLNATTGTKIWQKDIASNAPLCVTPDALYVCASSSKQLVCLNPLDGTERWNFTMGQYSDSAPTVINGNVYIGCQGFGAPPGETEPGALYCVSTDGTLLWSTTTPSDEFIGGCSPTVYNGRVYVGTSSGNTSHAGLYCYNGTTGTEIWNNPLSGVIIGTSPAIADNKVFVTTFGTGSDHPSGLFCVNPEDGTIIWNQLYLGHYVDLTSPAIADGKVYICLTQGRPGLLGMRSTVYCFD